MKCLRCKYKMKRDSITVTRNATRFRYVCPRCEFVDYDYSDYIITGIVKHTDGHGSGYIGDVSKCEFVPLETRGIE